ncbi:hypothetical protein BJX62DRAFT_212699 [Aspergillus germanicus]
MHGRGPHARRNCWVRDAGERVVEFLRELTDVEKDTIRADVISIPECIRRRNWEFSEQQPDQIFYDRATKKTYVLYPSS